MDPNFFTKFMTEIIPYIEDFITAFILLMYRAVLPIMGLGLFIAKFTPSTKDDAWFQKIIGAIKTNKSTIVEAKDNAEGKDPELFKK